jgi:hypothetical protein
MTMGTGLYKIKYKGRFQLLRIQIIKKQKFFKLNHAQFEPIERLHEMSDEVEFICRVNEDMLNEEIKQARITISWKDEELREFSMTVCDVWSLRNILLEFPFLKRSFNYLPRNK